MTKVKWEIEEKTEICHVRGTLGKEWPSLILCWVMIQRKGPQGWGRRVPCQRGTNTQNKAKTPDISPGIEAFPARTIFLKSQVP